MPVYVQHEVLGKVEDVFNADALWQAPGLSLFSRRALLRDLLERSPRELRGRAATRCFSHVTLVLPQDDVDDDRHLTRGARVRDLAQSLAALHQKDFGDLLGGDEVRYFISGDERIAPGEVQVKFGHAVYLPAPGEQVQYTVTASRDSAIWQPVCAIYPNQRLTLVGMDPANATFAVPGWPFGPDGGLLLQPIRWLSWQSGHLRTLLKALGMERVGMESSRARRTRSVCVVALLQVNINIFLSVFVWWSVTFFHYHI